MVGGSIAGCAVNLLQERHKQRVCVAGQVNVHCTERSKKCMTWLSYSTIAAPRLSLFGVDVMLIMA